MRKNILLDVLITGPEPDFDLALVDHCSGKKQNMSDLSLVTVSDALAAQNSESHGSRIWVDGSYCVWPSLLHLEGNRATDGDSVTILVVDDDKVDRMAVRRSFKSLGLANSIIEADNGRKALDLIRSWRECQKVSQPFLVLLDLHMPQMNGIEFLEEVRGDPALQHISVFVMITSSEERNFVQAYAKNVAGFVQKDEPGLSFLIAISASTHCFSGALGKRELERENLVTANRAHVTAVDRE